MQRSPLETLMSARLLRCCCHCCCIHMKLLNLACVFAMCAWRLAIGRPLVPHLDEPARLPLLLEVQAAFRRVCLMLWNSS